MVKFASPKIYITQYPPSPPTKFLIRPPLVKEIPTLNAIWKTLTDISYWHIKFVPERCKWKLKQKIGQIYSTRFLHAFTVNLLKETLYQVQSSQQTSMGCLQNNFQTWKLKVLNQFKRTEGKNIESPEMGNQLKL